MLELEFRAVFGAAWGDLTTDIRAFERMDGPQGPVFLAVSGPGGGVLSFQVAGDGRPHLIDQAYYSAAMVSGVFGSLTLLPGSGAPLGVVGTDGNSEAFGFSVSADGQIGDADMAGLQAHAGLGGPVVAVGASGMVYAMTGPDRLEALARTDDGYQSVQSLHDSQSLHLEDPVALDTLVSGGNEFLLSLGRGDVGLSVFGIANDGRMTEADSIGTDGGLGLLAAPTALETVTIGDRGFALIGSAADHGEGGALSVVAVEGDGSLSVTDHLLDTRNTRFGRVESVAVEQAGDWTYVVAGGGDAGLSLFAMTPEGRLLHMHSLADTLAAGLEQVSGLALHVSDGQLRVFAGSQGTQGITLLSVSLDGQGAVRSVGSGHLDGTADNDMLSGGPGDTELWGRAGDDILIDGPGTDRLTGGAGADLFVLGADDARDVIADFEVGQDRLDISAVPMVYDSSRLTVVERPWGAELHFPGGEITEIRSAQGRPLTAAEVFDAINWGPDRPPLALIDGLRGGQAGDTLQGTDADDQIIGDGGRDILIGLDGHDRLDGGSGGDTLQGGNGADTLRGGDGNDLLQGQLGLDFIEGGAGQDTLLGGAHGDSLFGNDGNDHIEGRLGFDELHGGLGDDTLFGGRHADTLWGGQGNDQLDGQAGHDRLFGDAGADILNGRIGFDELHGGLGDDTLFGGNHADTLWGEQGNDLLDGQAGHDRLFGDAGADTLIGQMGFDTLRGGDGDDRLEAGGMRDQLFGDDGNDSLNGQNGLDVLDGGAGDDTLLGGRHADTLTGGQGADLLNGEPGFDNLSGGDGDDTLLGGNNADRLLGDGGDDLLDGQAGHDRIFGGPGSDHLIGRLGNDRLRGGSEDDRLDGGDMRDQLFGEAGNDSLNGQKGFDRLDGGAGDDTLFGGSHADTLMGGDGADWLYAGFGQDELSGGAGADVFVFRENDASNRILDFTPGEDQLHLDVGARHIADLTTRDTDHGFMLDWAGGRVILEGVTESSFEVDDLVFL